MTVCEFYQDIKSRRNCYAVVERCPASPVTATLHISEVFVVPTFPALIALSDGLNRVQITQIQSIDLDGDHYDVVCGDQDELRETVRIFICSEVA